MPTLILKLHSGGPQLYVSVSSTQAEIICKYQESRIYMWSLDPHKRDVWMDGSHRARHCLSPQVKSIWSHFPHLHPVLPIPYGMEVPYIIDWGDLLNSPQSGQSGVAYLPHSVSYGPMWKIQGLDLSRLPRGYVRSVHPFSTKPRQ